MGGGADPTGDPEQIGLPLNADTVVAEDSEAGVSGAPPATQSGALPGSHQPAPLPTAEAGTATPVEPGAGLPAVGLPMAETHDASHWLDATCPYLRSSDGSWRSVVPQRGQRCWGQSPPAPLEPVTQERLCRTPAHLACEIYVAAEQRHLDSLARDHVSPERLDGRFGVLVRPSTLVLGESGLGRAQVPAYVSAARRTRVAVGLALAGVVVVIALFAGMGGGTAPAPTQPPPIAYATPSPAVPTAAPLTTTPTPSADNTPAPTPAPTAPVATPTEPPPTTRPSPRPSPRIRTTYRVKKGDTLAGIAAKFGVTTKQIHQVNDFGNPPHLRYGTLINIPYP